MFLDVSPVVLTVPVKICTKCGEIKPSTREYFYAYVSGSLHGRCRECDRAGCRAWRETHRDVARRASKKWSDANKERERQNDKRRRERNKVHIAEVAKAWNDAHKELKAELHKAWRDANKQHVSNQKKAWNTANKERVARANKEWHKANPSARKVVYHRYRARKLSLPDTFTSVDWQYALDYFGGCCAACGRPQGLWHTLAADHWIPLSKGGPTTPENIVPLCHGVDGCNNSKHDRTPSEWLIEKFGPRKGRAIQRRIETFLNSCKPKDKDADE